MTEYTDALPYKKRLSEAVAKAVAASDRKHGTIWINARTHQNAGYPDFINRLKVRINPKLKDDTFSLKMPETRLDSIADKLLNRDKDLKEWTDTLKQMTKEAGEQNKENLRELRKTLE